jgi:hypothetical protein
MDPFHTGVEYSIKEGVYQRVGVRGSKPAPSSGGAIVSSHGQGGQDLWIEQSVPLCQGIAGHLVE